MSLAYATGSDVYYRKAMKPCIFVVNKWDTMVGQMPTERWGTILPFAEVPIRLLFRKRESSDTKDEIETKRKS